MASSPNTEKVIAYALLVMTAVTGRGRRQFSVPRARLHCEHDGEYRASRVRTGARIRIVHRKLVNRTLGFSCRGDTGRTGHGPRESRFTDSIRGASIPVGGGLSVCCVVLWHRLSSRFARRIPFDRLL